MESLGKFGLQDQQAASGIDIEMSLEDISGTSILGCSDLMNS
jgi:hypothetical protein